MSKATIAMFEAITRHNPEELSAALLAGASVSSLYEEETPALCLALESHRAHDLVPLLLAHKAPTNRTDASGCPPLELAIGREDPVLVELLLKAGANPNAMCSDEGPLLHLALEASKNSGPITRLMLDYKAKPNALSFDDSPALAVVIERGDAELLDYFLAAGANPNLMDASESQTMLHMAMEASKNARQMTLSLLKHKANPNARDADDRPPLQIAIEARDLDMTEALLAAGADANALDDMDDAPMLTLALEAKDENPELARALLKAGARPGAVDASERSPLQIAIESEDADLLTALLKAGADPNVSSDSGSDSMLHLALAARALRNEMVAALLNHRADPNALDELDCPPLEIVIQQQDAPLAELLLQAGANANASTSDGSTLLALALETESSHQGVGPLTQALLKHKADASAVDDNERPPLQIAIEAENPSLVEALLEAGANPNVWDDCSQTPMLSLTLGASSHKITMVQALLHYRADPSCVDSDGQPPLQMAIEQEDAALVETLLSAGADANALNADGEPLLLLAIDQGSSAGPMVEALLRKGANPATAFDSLDRGPLEAAIDIGSETIALALLNHGADPKGEASNGERLTTYALDNDQGEIGHLLMLYASGRARPSPMVNKQPEPPTESAVIEEEEQPEQKETEEAVAIPANVKRRSIFR